MNTFGYGSDHDADLMDDLAKLKDGTFYFIEKVDDVGATCSFDIGNFVEYSWLVLLG